MNTTSREAATSAGDPGQRIRLPWPPPGLEPVHDTLWPLVSAFTTGALVLALPLLLAIGLDSPYWSLGTFGHSWWIPVATTLLGFAMLLAASSRLRTVLRDAARGAELGHGAWLILATAADRTRDNGFVLQGARSYGAIGEVDRRRLITVRGVAPLFYLAAALWIPFGLTLGALLGYAQVTGPTALWLITLAPAALCWLVGMLAHALAGTLARPARAAAAAATAELAHEADAWTANLALLSGDDDAGRRRVSPRSLRLASWAAVVPALLLFVVVIAVTGSTALGPALAVITAPYTGTVHARHAQLEVLRPYRLPTDPSISPEQAGHALHALMMMNLRAPDAAFRPPVREYATSWWDGAPAGSPLGDPQRWAVELMPRVAAGLTAEQRAFLGDVAAHPAHGEFELLAAAAAIDVAGTRFVSPLPADMTVHSLPMPRFGQARTGAYAHIGKAASELANGDVAGAERTVREVISAGLLMTDESLTLIDAMIGMAIARAGGEALVGLYSAAGRDAEADRLRSGMEASAAMADRMRTTAARPALADRLGQMPRTVVDDDALRGLRWEYLATFSTVSPCINLHQAVLGRDRNYQQWIAEAEQKLVRFDGDRQIFELARNGILGTRETPSYRCGLSPQLLRQIR